MALTQISTPSFAGDHRAGKYDNSYLPMQVFKEPIWDDMIWYQSRKWYLQSLIKKRAGEGPTVAANTIYWTEMGKLYHKETVATATGSAPNFVLELNSTVQYLTVDDVIDLGVAYPSGIGRNQLGVVTAVGTNGGNRTIDVSLIDPQGVSTLTNAQMPSGHEITLLFNRKGECWKIPEGRKNNPDRFEAKTTKIANTYKVCDEASDQQIWFKSSKSGRKYWVDEDEYNTQCVHRMHCDNVILFGEQSSFVESGTTYQGVSGYGLLPRISLGGYSATYSGTLLEQDIWDFITNAANYSYSRKGLEYDVLMGSDVFKDFQISMKDYHTGGSIFYGGFKPEKGNEIGINVQSYNFGGKKINVMEYDPFCDVDFLPANSGGTNFRKMALFLNLKRGGIRIRYKKRRLGGKYKEWLSLRLGPGFAPDGQPVSLDRACAETVYHTEFALQVKGINDHAILLGV